MEGTYYVEPSSSLTSPMYASTFNTQASQLGLSSGSKQIVAGNDVKCVISASSLTGTYKIYIHWSAQRLTQKVVTKTKDGSTVKETVEQNRVVSYVPYTTSTVIYATPD